MLLDVMDVRGNLYILSNGKPALTGFYINLLALKDLQNTGLKFHRSTSGVPKFTWGGFRYRYTTPLINVCNALNLNRPILGSWTGSRGTLILKQDPLQ
ncbi:17906_t:CDS:2 [Dentiscutata erythropus]|uniref:17906_t:CDS:1 n=1 Tax=Dentiscutata erythropus TaxID=1348616 RepID=A0A9N8Z8R0_9GLOM|nr:17906_t:CDS:2 [Dentiscutata erythropus]